MLAFISNHHAGPDMEIELFLLKPVPGETGRDADTQTTSEMDRDQVRADREHARVPAAASTDQADDAIARRRTLRLVGARGPSVPEPDCGGD